MATESILVRHGQAVWNPQGVLQARVAARYHADHWTLSTIHYGPTPMMARYPLGPVSTSAHLRPGPPTQSGLTPARAERVLHSPACVVCVSEHGFTSRITVYAPTPLGPVSAPTARTRRVRRAPRLSRRRDTSGSVDRGHQNARHLARICAQVVTSLLSTTAAQLGAFRAERARCPRSGMAECSPTAKMTRRAREPARLAPTGSLVLQVLVSLYPRRCWFARVDCA